MVLTFVLFILKPDSDGILWWNIVGHIFLLGIAGYGMLAVGNLWRKEKKRSATTLFIAFIVFALLILDDIIYMHFNAYYFFDLPEGILPFDYYFILFMLIMGVRLAREIWDKSVLEHQNLEKEKRWRKLLEEVQLVVIELDRSGLVTYANPYYYAISGFKPTEIMGRNWFLDFLPKDNGREVYNVFLENLDTEHHPSYDNPILTKQGEERMISWSNLVLYNSQGKPSGTISIGSDITERHKAFEEIEKLKLQLEVENVFLKAELGQLGSAGEIMGKSDAIRYVVHRARQVADTDTSVLLEGETGVGKEVVANFIQLNSRRKDAPYIKINCSALPAPLLESELFGHVRGAFTGAEKNKKGLVEVANGGTLFLDEIGEFPLELQPKLLRFLQDGEYKPVGSENTRRTDVRIIAATNRSMQKEIEDGNFRKDLYYRIKFPGTFLTSLLNTRGLEM
jgi:PAS domain S-box-containing protein